VRWRSWRAARMPCTAHMPVPRSKPISLTIKVEAANAGKAA
jgi:hypothetical protein